ncbi:MAG TPA: hypothetical protein VHZ24_08810 [Pirellulales bacterium]|jgi:hypothetical protein|nr:hypothetical protein [Pirellulales bacterium]
MQITSWSWVRGALVGLVAAGIVVIFSGAAQAEEPMPTTPAPTPNRLSPAELERAVRQALYDAARLKGLPDEAAVRRLTNLYNQVMQATDLPAARREPLRLALRQRLIRWGTLGQVLPPGGGQALGQGQQQQAATLGPELVELIEDTIAPESWEKRGGPGVIRFWGPSNALVVRQTTEAHEALAQLLRDLQ